MSYNLLFLAPSYDVGGAQKIASFVAQKDALIMGIMFPF